MYALYITYLSHEIGRGQWRVVIVQYLSTVSIAQSTCRILQYRKAGKPLASFN